MTTYDMPTTPGFRSSDFYLNTNTQAFESPITRTGQRMELSGARWMFTGTLPPMKADKARPWRNFFLLLKGRVNTFNAFDPDYRGPRGNLTPGMLVFTGGQLGNTLAIDGGVYGTYLDVGDYFSVNGELKIITQISPVNISGAATLHFEPPLRNSPPDDTPIIIDKPTCKMILVDDSQMSWPSNEVGVYQEKTFTAMEAIV